MVRVTHVTRTTTSFAPLRLPPIPMPEAIKLPTHLAQEQYPLAHEPTPDDMKWFTMKVGEQRVVISEDGPLKSPPTPSDTNGAGWQRALPASIAGGGMTLVDALNGTRGKGKRSHQTFAPQEPLSSSQLTPAGSMENLSSSVYPSPPRKRIRRPEDTRTPIPVETSGAPLSPLPSPELETPPPAASPSTIPLGPGHELAALYSLPSMLNHFDGLPDKLQQHVLMHMLRRSRMPTIQRIATFTTSAIKRDMISCLPREISVQILKCVDAKTLATSTRVCKKWKHIIDSERSVWKQRLIEDQLYCGQGVEEEDEAVLEKRFERLEDRNKQAESLRKAEADDWKRDYIAPPEMERSVPLKHVYRRRQQTQENWFNKRPVHNSFPGHGTNVITCLQFDRDKIISASDDNCINVYHTATGKIKKRLEGHEGGVWALQYRGDTLVTGSTDRSVRVWCLKTMRLTHTFTGHTSTVRCLTIVEPVLDEKTGKYFPPYPLIVTGSRDASLRVWKLPQRGEPNVVKWVGPHLQRGEADMLGSQCKRRKRVIARITRREPISSLCVDWTYRCDSSLGL
jgi:F-box and WD-40 domain protein CDC4